MGKLWNCIFNQHNPDIVRDLQVNRMRALVRALHALADCVSDCLDSMISN